MHLLHAESAWNHPAFFEYVDRWMNEDDTRAIAIIKAETGIDFGSKSGRQRQTADWLAGQVDQPSFIDDMWWAYRKKEN